MAKPKKPFVPVHSVGESGVPMIQVKPSSWVFDKDRDPATSARMEAAKERREEEKRQREACPEEADPEEHF